MWTGVSSPEHAPENKTFSVQEENKVSLTTERLSTPTVTSFASSRASARGRKLIQTPNRQGTAQLPPDTTPAGPTRAVSLNKRTRAHTQCDNTDTRNRWEAAKHGQATPEKSGQPARDSQSMEGGFASQLQTHLHKMKKKLGP